jgi:crotonobetainyl-CoA:carnitine CoA-transferase CaiB-like acyl-CoA transferase
MPQHALAGLLGLMGVEPAPVRFESAEPALQTPYRVGTAAAAALGACGIVAARLSGRAQEIAVDVRHAAASLRSYAYMKLDGPHPPAAIDKLTGFYPTKDGRWAYLHCNFPHHRDAVLRLVGENLEEGTRRWEGLALEEAVLAAGGAGGLARTVEEWSRHPHAHALSALPVLEVIRIGDAAPQRLGRGPRPLSGVHVLDLTRVIAGPTGARTLAEHGADVLKLMSPTLPNSGFLEFDTGHGKRSAHLDLEKREDAAILDRLIAETDVFAQSYRPGALARRGLSPEALARRRPGIVYVTLSAFGHAGPWAGRRGFDSIVQTVSGMALTQSGEVKPRLLPCSAIDYVSGYLMAFGAMVALARRAEEGGSWLVRASLAQTGRWIVAQGEGSREAPADFAPAELQPWLATSQTPLGRLTHLAPPLRMSATPPRWERPAVPLGHDRAAWV